MYNGSLREKTFVLVGIGAFHGTFVEYFSNLIGGCGMPKICNRKVSLVVLKQRKFEKVFSLESFPLYGAVFDILFVITLLCLAIAEGTAFGVSFMSLEWQSPTPSLRSVTQPRFFGTSESFTLIFAVSHKFVMAWRIT